MHSSSLHIITPHTTENQMHGQSELSSAKESSSHLAARYNVCTMWAMAILLLAARQNYMDGNEAAALAAELPRAVTAHAGNGVKQCQGGTDDH